MRWLAEACMFPMTLIPQEHQNSDGTMLKWSPDGDDLNGNSAILAFEHNNQTAKISFYFDPQTHMVTTIKAKRPRTIKGKTELTDWEGHFSDYELHGGLNVPSKMEVGWKVSAESPLELYFKGKNVKFIYLMNSHSGHKSGSEKMHSHAD
jgi:hypothetical protein